MLLFGESQEKQWAAAALASVALVWALTTHSTVAILVALGFCIGTWTLAARKYLDQPETKTEDPPSREKPA